MRAQECTQQEAADRLNLTTRQVKNLADQGMPTRSKQGKVVYPFPDCFVWYLDYKIGKAVEKAAPNSMAEAEQRQAIAEAQLAELKLERERGKVVTVEEAAGAVEELLGQLRATILTVPNRMASRVVGLKTLAEGTRVLDGLVAELLAVLSQE